MRDFERQRMATRRSDDRAGSAPASDGRHGIRLDKWLWAARFFKTRGLAQDAIEAGHVLVDGERVKVARLLRVDERVRIRVGEVERDVSVRGLSDQRGPAPVAQALYAETPDSIAKREAAREKRRLFAEPGLAIQGRPTKRERRQLDRAKDEH
jgi:ribosome-associated heat shock protein Hsp15